MVNRKFKRKRGGGNGAGIVQLSRNRSSSTRSRATSISDLADKAVTSLKNVASRRRTSSLVTPNDLHVVSSGESIVKLVDQLVLLLSGEWALIPQTVKLILKLLRQLRSATIANEGHAPSGNTTIFEGVLHLLLERFRVLCSHKDGSLEYVVAMLYLYSEEKALLGAVIKLGLLEFSEQQEVSSQLMSARKNDELVDDKIYRRHLETLKATCETCGKAASALLEKCASVEKQTCGMLSENAPNRFEMWELATAVAWAATTKLDVMNCSLELQNMFERDYLKSPCAKSEMLPLGSIKVLKLKSVMVYFPNHRINRRDSFHWGILPKILDRPGSYSAIKKGAVLREELNRWKQYKHENVHQILGETLRPFSYFLETMDVSLRDLLHEGNAKLSSKHAESIMRSVCRGLAFLHMKSVVHMQLCPRNILLNHENGSVVIAGFGYGWIHRRVGYPIPAMANYQAPEAFSLNARAVDVTFGVDIYAFASTAWEIVHGTVPFQESTYEEIHQLCIEGKRPVVTREALIPQQWFKYMLASCWASDAAVRPSARTLLQYIEKTTKATMRQSRQFVKGLLGFVSQYRAKDPSKLIGKLNAPSTESQSTQSVANALDLLVKLFEPDQRNNQWLIERCWELNCARLVLVQMQQHPNSKRIQVSSTMILANLVQASSEPAFSDNLWTICTMLPSEQETNQLLEKPLWAIDIVLQAVDTFHDDDSLVEAACVFFQMLTTKGHDTSAAYIRRDALGQIFPWLVATIGSAPAKNIILVRACVALRNLTFSVKVTGKQDVDRNLASILLRVLDTARSPQLVEAALGCLMNLSCHQQTFEENYIERLVPLLKVHYSSGSIQASLLSILSALCNQIDSVCASLKEKNVPKQLGSILRRHHNDESVAAAACWLIESMDWTGESQKRLNKKCDLVLSLLKEHSSSARVWDSGLGALRSLKWTCENKGASSAKDSVLKWVFASSCNNFLKDPDVACSAATLLHQILCNDDMFERMGRIGAIYWLNLLLSQYSEPLPRNYAIQEACCGALANIAILEPMHSRIHEIGTLDWVLKAMRPKNNKFIARNASLLIMRMAQTESIHQTIKDQRDSPAGQVKSSLEAFPELKTMPEFARFDESFPEAAMFLQDCAICMEPLHEQKLVDAYVCEHLFHSPCVTKWQMLQNSCPLCRSDMKSGFVPDDDVSVVSSTVEENEYLIAPFLEPGSDGSDFDSDEYTDDQDSMSDLQDDELASSGESDY